MYHNPTPAEAVRSIENAVREHGGDTGYALHKGIEAAYFDDCGKPSCLVGYVFRDMGITKSDLGQWNRAGISLAAMSLPSELNGDVFRLLRRAQAYNDARAIGWAGAGRPPKYTWNDVLRMLKVEFPDLPWDQPVQNKKMIAPVPAPQVSVPPSIADGAAEFLKDQELVAVA